MEITKAKVKAFLTQPGKWSLFLIINSLIIFGISIVYSLSIPSCVPEHRQNIYVVIAILLFFIHIYLVIKYPPNLSKVGKVAFVLILGFFVFSVIQSSLNTARLKPCKSVAPIVVGILAMK